MATAVAVAIAAKERRIVDRFRDIGATSASRAHTTHDVGITENAGFRRLRRNEVIRQAGPELFYLDEGVWIAVRRRRRRVAMAVLAVILLLFVGIGATFSVSLLR